MKKAEVADKFRRLLLTLRILLFGMKQKEKRNNSASHEKVRKMLNTRWHLIQNGASEYYFLVGLSN